MVGLDARHLALIGRELVRRGESVFVIEVDPIDGLLLSAASTWDLTGSYDQRTWRYACDLQGPSRVRTVTRKDAEVIHPRINVDPRRPWYGQPPYRTAGASSTLAARIEQALTRETRIPPSKIVPFPVGGEPDNRKRFQSQLSKGGIITMPTDSGFPGIQPSNSNILRPAAVGAEPNAALVDLRQQLTSEIFAY